MIVAVVSGKGGTGKTTVAVNLALSLGHAKILDCDVEEPNAYLLLGEPETVTETVQRAVPVIDRELCTLCGECAKFCRYNALFVGPENVVVFEKMCHSCDGCQVVCPTGAISEVNRSIGRLHTGQVNGISLVYGELDVGEPVATTLIRAVKSQIDRNNVNILDAPPGTACPVVETMRGSDYTVLVAEPTPFGLHDLSLVLDIVEQLGIPHGVVINRSGLGDSSMHDFCESRNVPILLEIPFDRMIAELYSRGVPFVTSMPEWSSRFCEMYEIILEAACNV